MSNRTDFGYLTRELQREHGFDDAAAERVETELHNAHVAALEGTPCACTHCQKDPDAAIAQVAPRWRMDLNGAIALLQLMTHRAPPPEGRRHCLFLQDGVLLMAIAIPYTHADGTEGAFLSFRLDGKGDLDRSPEDLAGAIMTLMPQAIAALATGDNKVISEPGKPTPSPGVGAREGAVGPSAHAGPVSPEDHTAGASSQPREEPAPRPDPPPDGAAGDGSHPTAEPERQPPLSRGARYVIDIAFSCASFIAAIDESSVRVAEYLAQRLAPIKDFVPYEVLQQIASDGRPAPSSKE